MNVEVWYEDDRRESLGVSLGPLQGGPIENTLAPAVTWKPSICCFGLGTVVRPE